MTAQEFSSEFDLLYNNISSAQAPGLTEYEKSVFLTKAQDEIIKNYFTNVQGGNKYQQGIEDSEKRYADFSTLLTVAVLNAETGDVVSFDERGKIFKLPDGKTSSDKKVMIVINETFKTGNTSSEGNPVLTSYQVIPLKFEEYIRLMSKPSSDPLKKQVWKLMGNSCSGNGSIEIVPHWKDKDNNINTLILKYIRKPYPIILEDLEVQGLSIEGKTAPNVETIFNNKKRMVFSGTLKSGLADSGKEFILSIDTPFKSGYNLTPENIINIIVHSFSGKNISLSLSLKIPQQSVTITASNYELKGVTNDEISNSSSFIDNLNITYGFTTLDKVCELAEELHPEILQRAVELAKIFYTGDNQQIMTAGTRSE